MPAYHPGQGLNKEALERLRARTQAEGHVHLPAMDESQQRDRLLGGDAKKKPRCGICTRPLSDEDQAAEKFMCSRCTEEREAAGPSEPRLKTLAAKACCATPSTDAASEDSEVRSGGAAAAARPAPPPAPPRDLEMAAARKRLEGDWAGADGCIYQVHFHREFSGTCFDSSSARTFTLTCDTDNQVIWWGIRKAFFLDVSELCSVADRAVWRPHGALHEVGESGSRGKYVWHRPHASPEPPRDVAEEGEGVGGRPGGSAWPSAEAAKAQAIQEVVEQISHPGSDGRVRIPRWNQRYRQPLGTLRQFLESCPERFLVHPGEGKEYTVSLAPHSEYAARGGGWGGNWAAHGWTQPAAGAESQRMKVQGQRGNGTMRWEPKVTPSPDMGAPAPEKVPVPAKAWARTTTTSEQKPAAEREPEPAEAPSHAKARTDLDPLAVEAVRRIEEQLHAPKSGGYVWIQNWNTRYLRHLGTLRSFLESRPDRFKVVPLTGKGYRVEMLQ